MKKLFATALACAILSLSAAAQDRLLATDLWGEDNILELTTDDTGAIKFIKATYNPGMGIQEIYSLDIADRPEDLHDVGIATSESIKTIGPNKYLVSGEVDLPIVVDIEKGKILFTIGRECYAISKPVDFLVEAWPLDSSDKPDLGRRTAYGVIRARKECFLGFLEKKWLPDKKALQGKIDEEAMFYPQNITLTDRYLTALVFDPSDDAHPESEYTYRLRFAPDPRVNLKNFLVLLALRSDRVGRRPLIHPALLAIYYYDALAGAAPVFAE
jgi:hypothetical protein